MKTRILALLMCIAMLLSFSACNKSTEQPADTTNADTTTALEETTAPEETTAAETGIWADAVYTEDKEFGEGSKTIKVEVIAEEKSVTFTIKTDAETLGEALLAHSLVEGENGQYGLYIKKVNGMLADYDVDQTYWGLTKDGEYLMSGADTTTIADGEHYELTRTK